jgi:periplasmic divalent cation tolerance protein
MVKGRSVRVVLVTCGTLAEARKVARTIVEKRLAACVNVSSARVESIYRWKGKIEQAREFLLIIKTTARRLKELEKEIARLHSYEVPEFLAVEVGSGSKKYMEWLITEIE